MLKLLVLDWDGTLANSIDSIIECKLKLAAKYQFPIPSYETSRYVLGMKLEDALRYCFPDVNETQLNTFKIEFLQEMADNVAPAALFPHVKETLINIRNKGIKLAVATSKSRKELDQAIGHHELTTLFDATCCGEEYEGKPHPAMLHFLMAQFNCQPEECLMIGDTTIDILFASNANIKTACVNFGAHSQEKLQNLKPLSIVSNWRDVITVIENY